MTPFQIQQFQLEHGTETLTRPNRCNHFEIIWFREGTGIAKIDSVNQPFGNDSIQFISPGQCYHLESTGRAEGSIISFTSEFTALHIDLTALLYSSGLFNHHAEATVVSPNEEMKKVIRENVNRMTQELNHYSSLSEEILRSLLKVLLLYLSRDAKKYPELIGQNKKVELIKKFFELLDKNYTSRKLVGDYAGEMSVSPNYLNVVVKNSSGFPASYHIQQRVVLEAKRQAVYAVNSMKEVAYNLGFEDMAHFSKYFKRAVGVNFTEFKKRTLT